MTQSLAGGCFCGNVRYEIKGPVLKSGVCHCTDCRRLTGGLSWPFMVVKTQDLHVTGDVCDIEKVAASGRSVFMGFCKNCGTTLFGKPDAWPHIRTVSASTLDDIHAFTPQMHVWTESAPSWDLYDKSLPCFAQNAQ